MILLAMGLSDRWMLMCFATSRTSLVTLRTFQAHRPVSVGSHTLYGSFQVNLIYDSEAKLSSSKATGFRWVSTVKRADADRYCTVCNWKTTHHILRSCWTCSPMMSCLELVTTPGCSSQAIVMLPRHVQIPTLLCHAAWHSMFCLP